MLVSWILFQLAIRENLAVGDRIQILSGIAGIGHIDLDITDLIILGAVVKCIGTGIAAVGRSLIDSITVDDSADIGVDEEMRMRSCIIVVKNPVRCGRNTVFVYLKTIFGYEFACTHISEYESAVNYNTYIPAYTHKV